ncbi:MAG TPA: tRNA lysidine(34) synthetase TilS [Lacunisphaera sp.]|nr:tRNA lysidine(34) synthetase TilS [Lacunisphaera sp.]
MATKKHPDWSAVAEALVKRINHGQLHPTAMQRALAEHRRECRGGGKPSRWALAFSGGADSLALLLIFWAEGPGRWGRDFVVMHFNHRLRGRAADGDEEFCRRVCADLGVRFVVGRWNRAGRALHPTAGPKARRTPSEAQLREARLAFFQREMKKRRIRLLWLAHQRDDIAETMLMRLARGSGASGLAAPRPVQEFTDGRIFLRPMLTLKKEELVLALGQSGATWREDASNAGTLHFRNRIRRQVVPAWQKAAGRDAIGGAALTRELLEEDDAALESWVDRLRAVRRGKLDLGPLAGLPVGVVRRALHRWLLVVRPHTDLSRQGFELLLGAVRRGAPTRFSLGRSGFAVIRKGCLAFCKA